MLGERLKELRLKAGLKQDYLLKKFNLSSARYSQYETGKRTLDYDLLIKLADFYSVTTDYLLGRQTAEKAASYPPEVQKALQFYKKLNTLPEDKKKAIEILIGLENQPPQNRP